MLEPKKSKRRHYSVVDSQVLWGMGRVLGIKVVVGKLWTKTYPYLQSRRSSKCRLYRTSGIGRSCLWLWKRPRRYVVMTRAWEPRGWLEEATEVQEMSKKTEDACWYTLRWFFQRPSVLNADIVSCRYWLISLEIGPA